MSTTCDIWLHVCRAWVSPSPNVTLFLQLRKTSCKGRTDIPHMFLCFGDSVCSNCLHPFSCFSHIFHSSFASSHYLSSISLVSCLSPAQILTITWRWTTSPSRSSCWPLGCPQLESEAPRHLQLLCRAATWFQRCLWRSLCSCFVTTDQCTHQLFPLKFNTNCGTCIHFF